LRGKKKSKKMRSRESYLEERRKRIDTGKKGRQEEMRSGDKVGCVRGLGRESLVRS